MKIMELADAVRRLTARELSIIEDDKRRGNDRGHRPGPQSLTAIVVKPGQPVERHRNEYHGDFEAIRNAMVPAHVAALDVLSEMFIQAVDRGEEPLFGVRYKPGDAASRRWFGIIDYDIANSGVVNGDSRGFMWERLIIRRRRLVQNFGGEIFHPSIGLLEWFERSGFVEVPF